jgi:NCAIR mutase (PurE)-related protein
MEGALPSVVAGLFSVPHHRRADQRRLWGQLQGRAALLAMLNSCPGGVGVVNTTNGFRGAYLASLINHLP